MASFFVTGASRGIGYELVSQLSEQPASQVSVVFAAIRSRPSEQLRALIERSSGRVIPVTVTITDRASIDKAVSEVETHLAGKGLDFLINNAGVMPLSLNGIASMTNLSDALEVNVQAVQDTTSALMPLLEKGSRKQIINMYMHSLSSEIVDSRLAN
jgi:NADP-dependent 3-hydroxy acid dehydrogenase YdfG